MELIPILFTAIWMAFWLGIVIVHIWLALYVLLDAKAYDARNGLFLASPLLWGFIVLVTGIVGLALYWLVHYSTLRRFSEKTRY